MLGHKISLSTKFVKDLFVHTTYSNFSYCKWRTHKKNRKALTFCLHLLYGLKKTKQSLNAPGNSSIKIQYSSFFYFVNGFFML
jgi:hypothetical protein